jgi:hypothetical protein
MAVLTVLLFCRWAAPTSPVEFGILVDGRVTVLQWFEFCRHYALPPQYVVACWNRPVQ